MPDLEVVIDPPHVRGNDLDIIRTVSVIPTGQVAADAYLRVNTPTGSTQLFEKHITSTLIAGQGQIEDTGVGDNIAIIRFEITAANSLLMTPGGTATEPTNYPYGIEIRTDAGKVYEFEQGVIPVVEQIVVAV
jgi:hypothetical protein